MLIFCCHFCFKLFFHKQQHRTFYKALLVLKFCRPGMPHSALACHLPITTGVKGVGAKLQICDQIKEYDSIIVLFHFSCK